MRRRGCGILLTLVFVLVSSASTAQERGHVAGVFGWTYGDETAMMYGAQFGVGVGATIQIIGSIERMNDVLTGRYALLLNNLSEIANLDIQGEVPGTYGGAGARFTFPGLAAAPFLQAELGATQTDATGLVFRNDDSDDITEQLPDEVTQLLVKTTSFTVILSAGVRFDITSNVLAEASFDFMDILTEREGLGLNRLSFAVGVRF